MIKESKYIIRRILIGVGIVLVLSMINSCKVKAFEWNWNSARSITKTNILNNSDIIELKTFNHISVYKNNVNNSIYMCADYSSTCQEWYFSNYNFEYTNIGIVIASPESMSNSNYYMSCVYLSNGTLPLIQANKSNAYYYANTYDGCVLSRNSSSSFTVDTASRVITTPNTTDLSFLGSGTIPGSNSNFDSSIWNFSSNYNWNYYSNSLVPDEDIIGSTPPEFVSWNYTKNTSNNVITGYTFSPEFSNFDTENYTYYYKFGNSNWLTLTENEQNININANGTIYVKVVENSSSNIIDSATFTITDLGTFDDPNVDYNIKISGQYRTENYLNNQITSSSQSIIKEYQLYIDYFPKNSILKYQYQYVLENNTLDSNSWETLSSSNNGSRTYVVSQNGTLYARILDSEDNVLSTATFVVNSIGKLALDNNDTKIDNFFTKISNKINYGGPVSSLFHIPVELLSSLYTSMSDSSTCSPFSLNQLLGVNMKYDCINFKNIVGNDFYNIIDMIFTFIISIGIFKFIIKLYNDLVSMNDIS